MEAAEAFFVKFNPAEGLQCDYEQPFNEGGLNSC
jgi:hypothetical protein